MKEQLNNFRNCYAAEKHIISKQSNIYLSEILVAQIEDVNEDCVKISRPYLLYLPRNKLSKSVTVEPDRTSSSFYDSANFKMFVTNLVQLVLNYFKGFKSV